MMIAVRCSHLDRANAAYDGGDEGRTEDGANMVVGGAAGASLSAPFPGIPLSRRLK